MKNFKITLLISATLLVVCSVLPFLFLGSNAFSTDRLMDVLVSFPEMIKWINTRWFSLDSIAGLVYLLTLILSVFLILIALAFYFKTKLFKIEFVEKIIYVALIVFIALYSIAFIINIFVLVEFEASAYFVYFFSELLKLISLIILFVLLIVQKKKYI